MNPKLARKILSGAHPARVTPEQATNIIEIRQPRGKFYCIEDGPLGPRRFVGIDNEDGEAWTEDFGTLRACKRWLTG